MNELIAIVPVRAGSKGLPSKNIRQFCGKALYFRAAKQGIEMANRCIVNTDIAEIIAANMPLPEGVELQSRASDLGGDDTPISSVLIDSLEKLKIRKGTILLLQATSPLRLNEDIQNAIDFYAKGEFPIVFTVNETNPIILKNGFLEDGRFSAVSKIDYLFQNRQVLPQTFKPNGAVYVFDAEWFMHNRGFNSVDAGAVVMPTERSLDVDTLDDFLKAEKVFQQFSTHT